MSKKKNKTKKQTIIVTLKVSDVVGDSPQIQVQVDVAVVEFPFLCLDPSVKVHPLGSPRRAGDAEVVVSKVSFRVSL